MIPFHLPLTVDSTMIWILAIAVVLVFLLEYYVRRLISKPAPVTRSAVARAKRIADDRPANIKR